MKITSRDSREFELDQMRSFATQLTQFELARWVSELYFDSQWSTCVVLVDPMVAEGSWVAKQIRTLAEQIFSQFEMFGIVYHGIDAD